MKYRTRPRMHIREDQLLSRDPLEREVKAVHLRMLAEAGFHVCDVSQPRAVYGGLVNFPDVIAFYNDATILIEEKKKGGPVREGQLKFAAAIEPFLGDHLRHLIAPTDDQLWNVINEVRGLPWRNRDRSQIHIVMGLALQGETLVRWPVKSFRLEAAAKAYAVKANAVRESMKTRRAAILQREDMNPTEKQGEILKLYNQYDKVNNSFYGHPDCGAYYLQSLDHEG